MNKDAIISMGASAMSRKRSTFAGGPKRKLGCDVGCKDGKHTRNCKARQKRLKAIGERDMESEVFWRSK